MCLVLRILFCVNFLIVGRCQEWVVDDEGCRTPNGDVGDCIPVRQCRPMIEAIKSLNRPLSQHVTQQLNSYSCSFSNNVAHICCPQGPIIIQEGENESPPDVSNHRNLRLLPTNCGYLDPGKDRIRNGKNAEINEFPWMALLSYRTRRGPEFKCGGTIINDRYILTAAHCIKNLESPLLGVRVGEYDIKKKQDCAKLPNGSTICTPGYQDLAIEEINPHSQFNASVISNDIGLIRVSKMNLKLENTRPVCLPTDDLRNENFKNVIITGWGITNVLTGESSSILQKVNLPVVELDQCKNVYKNQSNVHLTFKQVCAGGKNNKDSCQGDSGGPLHQAAFVDGLPKYIQQGVVSFGPRECGLEGYPGVYTRVAYYMDWILDTIRP
ncbi:phenoloxidase-activating factor 3-like [Diorhabda sublineata]|uniref:phenoloxidase-activating factor 3-like n=1 Tax=Diorhabda sublineata TaxID=1163346 RepID=UPI0024E0580B|nr:phenoloxidase-activating factor 3-like [Diorhabda sublineata]